MVFVGVGGYGGTNLYQYTHGKLTDCTVVGVVSRRADHPELNELNIPVYKTLEDFYAFGNTADLVVVSSPIQLHAEHCICAMKNGSNVITEKPISSTVEEALEMRRVSRETGKFVNIGYQASFAEANLNFKADVTAGVYGKPLFAKTICLWPRTETYFHRNSWAGKLKTPEGEWVLDSVANNATAHYLHNMFFVLGGGNNRSLYPDTVEFELYRGNDIETFDTCALRAMCGDVPLLFLVSHNIDKRLGPQMVFGFENGFAEVVETTEGRMLTGHLKDGTSRFYGDFQLGEVTKLQRSIDMVLGKAESVCEIDAALPQTLIIRELHRGDFIHPLETVTAETGEGILHYVPTMREDMIACWNAGKLPSEMGVSWSRGTVKATVDKEGV